MHLSDFDFDLPERLIATRPARPRTSARLLLAQDSQIQDRHVHDLPQIFQPGDLLVLNDTKVIPARLHGTRRRDSPHGSGEARIEVTLLEPQANPGTWTALIKPLRKINIGETIHFAANLTAELTAKDAGQAEVNFNCTGPEFDAALSQAGALPLPPYIAAKRPADAQDMQDYQTVFAENSGAVAAPTASLHFDDALLADLAGKGVEFAHVTLHVGAGTFLPVKVEDVTTHKMHAEWGRVSPQAAAQIARAKSENRRVIPVGTTALRLIESAAAETGQIAPWEGPTDIFIYPGFTFNVTSALMTNFHLPKSTLMMLVSALMGKAEVDAIYAHAIAQDYRFFSYGDSSLLIPRNRAP
jgi:S-adenosylmethionine:tRNA ribosyltransferase-isomerase